MPRIILASQSPRRRQLLGQLGLEDFTILVPDVDESYDPALSPEEIVSSICRRKARAARDMADDGEAIIIAADTMVFLDGLRLGKPHTLTVALGKVLYYAVVNVAYGDDVAYLIYMLRTRNAAVFQRIHKAEVFLYRHIRIKRRLFGQEAYLGLRLKRLFEYVRTVYLRRSAGGGQVAGEDVERRRLACAVRAEKAHYLALGDIECDVLEHVLCAEIFVYTVDLDHVRTLPPF